MEISNFTKLISQIQSQPDFFSELPYIEQDYLVKIYKITELTVPTVLELYATMQKKFYLNRRTSNEEAWYENELRLFIWLLFGYLHVHRKGIEHLNEDDWNFFSPIFNHKSTVFFEFQSLSLLRPQARPAPWGQQQTSFLQIIISEKNYKNRWNSIARELFIRSSKRFFRNPKQCRQRWMNHLDPSKLHTQWTPFEDFTLLTCIKKKGKRWSVAMKELGNTRTEHMVKNRYKSLISNESKRYPGKKDSELENVLIKKLNKLMDKHNKESEKDLEKSVQSPKCLLKAQQSEIVNEQKDQKVQVNFSLEGKSAMKEEVKIENEHLCFNFEDNIGSDFHDFGVNSPMFIPWNQDDRRGHFDMDQGRSRNNHFGADMSEFNSDDLPF